MVYIKVLKSCVKNEETVSLTCGYQLKRSEMLLWVRVNKSVV